MHFDFDERIERRTTNSIKWTLYPSDVLPLWVADMDFRCPPPILEALGKAVAHGIFGYEQPSIALKRSVAGRMERLHGWKVDPDWVVTVTGLVSGFYAAARTVCLPGDGYLIQPPVYMPFNDLDRHLGLVRQEAPLARADRDGSIHHHINWEEFDGAFDSRGARTKMFLLCSPHNPTGELYDEGELSRMAATCLEKGAILVSDEIHAELLLGKRRHRPVASLSPDIAARSITLIAPSKTFNIAGLFCGFALIPDAGLRRAYENEVERMTLHSASLSLVAAEAAFSGECEDWLAELLAYLTANRDFVAGYIARHLPSLSTTRPDATYLAWIDVSRLGLEAPARFFLDKAKLALNDGETFGTGGKGCLRLNFGCPRSILEEALERMATAIGEFEGDKGPRPRV